jgi:hypothetical protein
MMKVTAKHDETFIPDEPCFCIGLKTVPEPSGLNYDAVFEAGAPPEKTATTSRAKDSIFGHIEDDVLVLFNLRCIGTTPEMSSTRHFDEETG